MSVDPLAQTVEQFAAAELERKASRYAQIRRLLAVRDEHFVGRAIVVRESHAAAGFVHQTTVAVTCDDCLGEQPAQRRCGSCGGRGTTDVRRDRDPYAVGKTLPYGMGAARHLGHEPVRDSVLARLEAQLAAPASEADLLAAANEHGYPWEHERAELYARWDLAALDVAVERLTYAMPRVPPASDRGVRFIEPHMPQTIRAPVEQRDPVNANAKGRGAHPDALRQRDKAIRQAVLRDDLPVQWVARQHGLSVATVYRILKRQEAA